MTGQHPAQAEDFASLVDLAPTGPGRYRNRFSDLDYQGGHMFGGQLVAQSLAAVIPSLEGKQVHSLHAYFLRPGDVRTAIDYVVEHVRDGRSYASRRVRAEQHGRPLFEMLCSASTGGGDLLDHQEPPPQDVPPPESLASIDRLSADPAFADCRATLERLAPMRFVDCRPVDPERQFRPGWGGPVRVWLRMSRLGAPLDEALQTCMIGYLQDYWIAFVPWTHQSRPFLGETPSVASIDGNAWFHRPAPDDWLLFDLASPVGTGATGLSVARLLDRDGRVIATAAQEVLYRVA